MAGGQQRGKDWDAVIHRFQRHGRHVEPYSRTTQSSVEHMRKRWQSFCLEATLGDPAEVLRKVEAAQLKAFFLWMIENAERSAPQAGTLKQYFRILKMIYKRDTGAMLDEELVADVNAVSDYDSGLCDSTDEGRQFIQYYAEGKKETSHRPKPVPSGADFVHMLHFLYSGDTTTYPDERQRVQQGLLMIIHASSGLRPSSTTQSSKGRRKRASDENAEEVEDVVKLRYRDFALLISEDEQGRTRFAVQATFQYFKGGNRRPQRKTFTWPDQADILTCPVAHLAALALHDEAFQSSSLNCASSLLSLTAPRGRQLITVPWRNDILNKPILRESSDMLSGVEVQGGATAKRLKSLGEKMGYPETVTWYWLRRLVLNSVDASGSEEVRNQVAGHLDSRTYRNNYQDQRITLDVASLVRGQATEDALIRKLNDIGTNADPDANVALPPEALEYIASLPDVTDLKSEHLRLLKALQDKFGSITKAPASEELVRDYTRAKTAYRTRKEFHKARMRSQMRKDFFSQKNAALIEAQFDRGDKQPTVQVEQEAPTLFIPERIALANLIGSGDIRDPSLQAHRAVAVQALANLCSRAELKRKPFLSKIRPREGSSPEPDVSKTEERFPKKCHRLQCLFCIGDERLHFKERTRVFSQQYTLGRHVENHIKALQLSSGISCPHPICKAADITLDSMQHLKNHAQREHGIRLQSR